MNNLENYILLHSNESEEIEEWLSKFRLQSFKKGATILEIGARCQEYYFVSKGAIRMYMYDEDKEITVWLCGENTLFTHLDSFNNSKPSDCAIEAIEDVVICLLSKNDYETLMRRSTAFARFILSVWQDSFIKITKAIVAFQSNSAYERYDNIQENTDFALRFKQKFIASFLGITPTSLSRLRKKK